MSDHNEAMRLADEVRAVADRLQYTPGGFYGVETIGPLNEAAALLRKQAADLKSARAETNRIIALLDAANDERKALRAEVERLRVDAERYEWLRDCHPADKSLWVAMGLPHAPGGVSCWRNDELDTAIDTARKATQ